MLDLEGHLQDKLYVSQESTVTNMLPRKHVSLQTVHTRVFLEDLIEAVHWNEKNNGIDVIEVRAPGVPLSPDYVVRNHNVKRQDRTCKFL